MEPTTTPLPGRSPASGGGAELGKAEAGLALARQLPALWAGRDSQLYRYAQNRQHALQSLPPAQARLLVAERLVKICEVLGIAPQNLPSPEGKRLIVNFVLNHFGHLHIDEITYAYELALMEILPVKRETYGRFSLDTFTRILRAYLHYRAEGAKRIAAKLEKLERLQQYAARQAANAAAAVTVLCRFYESFLTTSTHPVNYPITAIFEWLRYCGLITISPFLKEQIITQAETELRAEKTELLANSGSGQTLGALLKQYEQRYRYLHDNRCRHLTLRYVFAGWQDEGLTAAGLKERLEARYCFIDPDSYRELTELRQELTNP